MGSGRRKEGRPEIYRVVLKFLRVNIAVYDGAGS